MSGEAAPQPAVRLELFPFPSAWFQGSKLPELIGNLTDETILLFSIA
jgi:hypothetical protein